MMMMFDFRCSNTECEHVFEKLVQSTIRSVDCPECSAPATRCISAPHIDYLGMGLDPAGNPTAADKWAKMHEKMGGQS